MQNSVL